MAVMSREVKDLFEKVPTAVFSTSSLEGQPNAAPVGMKKVVDDETVYVSDQFFRKTLANVRANAKVSLVFWGDEGAYQLHGTARYVNEGDEFAEQKKWADGAFAAIEQAHPGQGRLLRARGRRVHVEGRRARRRTPGLGSGGALRPAVWRRARALLLPRMRLEAVSSAAFRAGLAASGRRPRRAAYLATTTRCLPLCLAS